MRARRAPRWLAEAVAWTAAMVLVADVAIAASGYVQHKQQVRAAMSREIVEETPALVEAGSRTRVPRGVPQVSKGGRASVAVSPVAALGPPPGPQVDRAPARYASPENRWAFLVGIRDYRSPTHDTLAGDRDVAFIRSYLLSAGWAPDHIRVLTNKQATGSAMREGLRWLAAKSTPGTFALFHYSGHVKQAGGHEKLWPVDRSFIPDDELEQLLAPSTGKLWVDIAGCEAAGFIESLPSDRVLVSTSSKSTQKSYEHPEWRESVWVGLMWDAGMNQRQADADGSKVVTVGEALRFASYWAQVVTYSQRPHGRQSPQVRGMPVRGWTLADPPA